MPLLADARPRRSPVRTEDGHPAGRVQGPLVRPAPGLLPLGKKGKLWYNGELRADPRKGTAVAWLVGQAIGRPRRNRQDRLKEQLMPSRRPPFRGLTAQQYFNLALALPTVAYILFGLLALQSGLAADYLAADYRSFISSARISTNPRYGFAHIYDLSIQEQFQRPLYNEITGGHGLTPYATAPTYYLPAFVLPFLPLVIFPFKTGYLIWILLNAAGTVLYLWRFKKAIGGRGGYGILGNFLLYLPLYPNLILGQVNLWLMICMGEFFLACRAGKEFRAGLWLAGLLLKPQTLIFLIPGLLLSRRFRALGGFSSALLVILVLSVVLVGIPGMIHLGELYLLSSTGESAPHKAILNWTELARQLSAPGEPTTHAEVMMNWRAVAINLLAVFSAPVAWGLAFAGMGLTALAGLSLWLRRTEITSPRFGLVLLGTYAATCAVTWHSHVHMILPLLPLALYLYSEGTLSWPRLYAWLYGMPLLLPVFVLVAPALAYTSAGLLTLALNLYLTAWAVGRFWHRIAPAG